MNNVFDTSSELLLLTADTLDIIYLTDNEEKIEKYGLKNKLEILDKSLSIRIQFEVTTNASKQHISLDTSDEEQLITDIAGILNSEFGKDELLHEFELLVERANALHDDTEVNTSNLLKDALIEALGTQSNKTAKKDFETIDDENKRYLTENRFAVLMAHTTLNAVTETIQAQYGNEHNDFITIVSDQLTENSNLAVKHFLKRGNPQDQRAFSLSENMPKSAISFAEDLETMAALANKSVVMDYAKMSDIHSVA